MGKGKGGYERITELMALLMSDKYKDDDDQPALSVREISKLTGFPITLVQRDVAMIVSNLYIGGYIVFENDKDMDTDEWVKLLNAGDEEACDERFYISKDIFWPAEETEYASPVNLKLFEKNLFAKILHKSDISDVLWVKESFMADSRASYQRQLRDTLQVTIENHKRLSFTNNEYGKKTVVKDFSPAIIYETVENGILYIVGVDSEGKRRFFRLDCIHNPEEQDEEALIPAPEELEKLDYMWGADDSDEERTGVKIKILNNTKNIITKIKAVADGRKYAKLYPEPENDGVWYYEDTVCGMNSFKKWLRSFGASVVALEPLWLAEDMYQSAVRRLQRYEEHRFD